MATPDMPEYEKRRGISFENPPVSERSESESGSIQAGIEREIQGLREDVEEFQSRSLVLKEKEPHTSESRELRKIIQEKFQKIYRTIQLLTVGSIGIMGGVDTHNYLMSANELTLKVIIESLNAPDMKSAALLLLVGFVCHEVAEKIEQKKLSQLTPPSE